MPSSPKIPKEKILAAALDMLKSEGYEAITISTLAKKLECSTQPISWHFGNMENFRRELTEAAWASVHDKMNFDDADAIQSYEKVGLAYVELAIENPNLFKFLRMSGEGEKKHAGFATMLNSDRNRHICEQLSVYLSLSFEDTLFFMQTVVLFTHGMASLIASGDLEITKDEALDRIRRAGVAILRGMGVTKINDDGSLKNE
ncbi:MAG: TetR/AcrR family transcriptional regulator [Treponemataceae bacterium]|nr:TetR/AcrR family transcriptional regulator [Treponemataceae bacterium]